MCERVAFATTEEATVSTLQNNGLQAFRRGAFAEAVRYWEEASRRLAANGQLYEQGKILLSLPQALQALGQYREATAYVEHAVQIATQLNDQRLLALAKSSRGSLLIAMGNAAEAAVTLREALTIARAVGDTETTASVLNNLGTALAAQTQYEHALETYKESLTLARASGDRELVTRVLTNAAKAALLAGRPTEARTFLLQAGTEVYNLEHSYSQAAGLLMIGTLALDLRSSLSTANNELTRLAVTTLVEAARVAESLGDLRTASYAWGYLGHQYEEANRLDDALQLTWKAVFAAQRVHAPEVLYRWQWQVGRLLQKSRQREDAIAAYQSALDSLQSIRHALLSRGATAEFFRDAIEPVYFELVDLLLQRAADLSDPAQRKQQLVAARDTVEQLKVAELRNYFQDACVAATQTRNKNLDDIVPADTAVIYPIPLPDRLELLVTLPGGFLKSVTVAVKKSALLEQVQAFRRTVVRRPRPDYLPHAQQLYNWLIRPLEPNFDAAHVTTLVFIPHGLLRTIPPAALHDGTHFLISKYAVAVTPGLTLTDPRPLPREGAKLLAAGLTDAVQGFPPLPNVGNELQNLRQLYGIHPLLNQEFLETNLAKELDAAPLSIVHLASHGQFAGDRQHTFILTYNERLTLDRLAQLLEPYRFRENPLELLTLSACETAAGDDRAALGLAGVAVKAGARSALATLWTVPDDATAVLVEEFYRQLKEHPAVSRAVALQRAQQKLLNDERFLVRHPGTWAQFLLINNWM